MNIHRLTSVALGQNTRCRRKCRSCTWVRAPEGERQWRHAVAMNTGGAEWRRHERNTGEDRKRFSTKLSNWMCDQKTLAIRSCNLNRRSQGRSKING